MELQVLYNQSHIIQVEKSERLRWASHAKRQEDGGGEL